MLLFSEDQSYLIKVLVLVLIKRNTLFCCYITINALWFVLLALIKLGL